MNIPNELKHKVINNEKLSKYEINLFLDYIIHKSLYITSHMYNKKYPPIFLLYEICWSYNIDVEQNNINNRYFAIIELNNKKYILDPSFNNKKLDILFKNKYIEYTKDNYEKYINLLGV